MAKATQRPLTDDTAPTNEIRNTLRLAAVTHGDIARLRGASPGRDVDDWLLAEMELRGA